MAKQGRRIPETIRAFILQTLRNAPNLIDRLVVDLVTERFGEANKVDRTTVSRIRIGAGLAKSTTRKPVAGSLSPVPSDYAFDRHRAQLIEAVLSVRGIEPMALHHYDLAVWWSNPQERFWPIPKGHAYQNEDEGVSVTLEAEKRLEWNYLRQHLLDDPMWKAVEAMKNSIGDDLAARMALLEEVVRRVELPVVDGGTGLPLLSEIRYDGTPHPAVSLHYAFDVFDQVLSQALNLRQAPHPRESFDEEVKGVTQLAGQRMVSSADPEHHSAAIDVAIRASREWKAMPEAEVAAKCYRSAEERTALVNSHVDRINLMVRLPSGTTCEGCAA